MKFPLSLLTRFLDTTASLDDITTTLTRIGLEVEGVEDKSADLAPFEVAEVVQAEKHPDADKLKVCKVKTSDGELQIVCGAPNARAGIKVALAKVGSVIPTNGMKIKASKIRGVESSGMLCSAAELGLSEDHEGIIELPETAKFGESIVETLHLNDPVIELSITPNRGDCFGVYGVARDLAAAGVGSLKPLEAPKLTTQKTEPLSITIEDSEACPQFIGRRITGVKNGPSPEWLQRALTAAGMRPISKLVDVTNFFALAYGRPLHVFDAAKVTGALNIRGAANGETLQALDEKTYKLRESDCVIADDTGTLALGGIMGGISSGVSDTTTDIILETAMFDPVRIAFSAQHHQILSDARTRFERGVDPAFLPLADQLATALILELCGGEAGEAVIAGTAPSPRSAIELKEGFINHLGGVMIDEKEAQNILKAVGCEINKQNIIPPSWRHDITCPVDLAEEVLRMIGYDNIPAISLPKPKGNVASAFTAAMAQTLRAKRILATRGLHETVSFAFISAEEAKHFGGGDTALMLQNPIAEQLNTMRPNLLPGLLSAAQENMARGQKSVALFESGAVFTGVTPSDEAQQISGIRIASNKATHWQAAAPTDLFSVKADLAAILDLFGLDIESCQITRDAPEWYHPGRSGAVKLGPKVTLATFGELHPHLNKRYDIDTPIYAFEIMPEAFPKAKPKKYAAAELSDYQAVTRDFAFIIDQEMEVANLVKTVRKVAKPLLRDVHIFDVYEGEHVDAGKRSIAFSVVLQADDRTLNESEISDISAKIIESVEKLGASLR